MTPRRGREALTAIDARDSDGVIVYVFGAIVTISSDMHSEMVHVVVTPDERKGYQTRWQWFPAIFGSAGQLVCRIWR